MDGPTSRHSVPYYDHFKAHACLDTGQHRLRREESGQTTEMLMPGDEMCCIPLFIFAESMKATEKVTYILYKCKYSVWHC